MKFDYTNSMDATFHLKRIIREVLIQGSGASDYERNMGQCHNITFQFRIPKRKTIEQRIQHPR